MRVARSKARGLGGGRGLHGLPWRARGASPDVVEAARLRPAQQQRAERLGARRPDRRGDKRLEAGLVAEEFKVGGQVGLR